MRSEVGHASNGVSLLQQRLSDETPACSVLLTRLRHFGNLLASACHLETEGRRKN
jgi:hypothetical protein